MALELVRPWALESPAIGRLSTTNPLAQKVAALVMPAQGYAIVNGVAVPLFPPVAITRRQKFGGYWYAGTSGQYANLGTLRNVASRQRFSIFSTWLSDDGQYQGADASRYIVSCRTAGNAGWSWGRSSAIAGGSDGTVTRQTLVFQGVAVYLETGYAFPSFTETSAGATISASTWLTYKNGVQQESIAVGTMTTGGEFFFGAQDGVAGSEWLDRAGITVIFDDVLSAAEMASLHADPAQLFEPRVFSMPQAAAGGDVTLALSGEAATASAGTLANSRTVAASGQAATASAGTVAPSRTKALSGQAVTASAGTVTQSKARALSGQAVTASAGTLGETRTVALSGQAATASAGTVTYTADGNITLALSGQALTASAGTLAPSRSVAVSGQAATASAGTAAAGRSITATGTQITTAAGTLTLGIVVPLAGQAAAAGAGTVSYSTAGAVVVALTGQAVEASAGTIGYAAQILSAAPIGHGTGMSRRSPSKGGSRAPQLSTRTR